MTGLEQQSNLDFDLELDESLFEHKSQKSRAKSEGHLNKEAPGGDHQNLPRRYQRASSQGPSSRQPGDSSGEPTTIQRENRSYGDLPIHQSSRRTSTTSDCSDFSSEFLPSEGTRSHNSSLLFKSVRFDIEVDSAVDSGVMTGNSTPYYPERRASEPEFKATRHQERRASAPECTTPESLSDEGSGNGQADVHPKEDGAVSPDSGIGGESRASDVSDEKDAHGSQTLGEAEGHEPSDVVSSETRELVSSPAGRNTDKDSPPPPYPEKASEDWLTSERPQVPNLPGHVVQLEPSNVASRSRVKVAHLIEQWRHPTTEPSAPQLQRGVPKPAKPVKGVGHKITAIMHQLQQQPVPSREPNQSTQSQEDDSHERRPAKQLSKLVTETTKQLLEPPVPVKEKDGQGLKPQKLNVQWPKVESSEIGETPVSSSSSLLAASMPKVDLTNTNQTRRTSKEGRNEARGTDSHSDTEVDLPQFSATHDKKLKYTGDKDDHEQPEAEDQPPEEEQPDDVPWFERLPTIPIFTGPFASNFQPAHLKSTHAEQFSSFWTFAGQDSGAPDDTEREYLQFEDDSDCSSEDEDMLEPLSSSVGFPSISPIGKTLFSSRPLIPGKARFQGVPTKGMKKTSPFSESLTRSFPQQRLMKRLSAIPEESPELTRSTRSSTTNIASSK